MSETPAQAAKAEAAKQAVILVFAVATMVAVMAVTNRDLLRTYRMRVAEASRRLLTSLAQRAGHTSMGIELAAGTEQYHLPLLLSRMRDKAQAAYDRAREVLCRAAVGKGRSCEAASGGGTARAVLSRARYRMR